ncbi:MAG: exonuclease domain-containing protein, partial [Hydrogenophaga sp.]|nr:exonuclease domain-containing protein [Hydrogenophaga sp.]
KTIIGQVTDSLVMAKELFPGKRNGLDALCDRLGVDNSGRTLHGALLDAELLADVYINMTRGQDALLMDLETSDGECGEIVLIDLSRIELPVVRASEQEAQAHEAVLLDLDKACKGKTVWRQMQAA